MTNMDWLASSKIEEEGEQVEMQTLSDGPPEQRNVYGIYVLE